ncbi:MAG: DHH family phosphoesterase [Candidatus Pacearchaeota archaeon]
MQKIVITHSDADGIISAYLIQKALGKSQVLFSGQNNLFKVLDSIKNKKQKLIILDISPTKEILERVKIFNETLWIDHHEEQEIQNIPTNIKLIIKQKPSTAEIIAEEFKLNNEKIVKIANEIDTNNVKLEEAEKLRDYVSYIRDTAKGIIFTPMARELITKLDNLAFLNNPHTVLKLAAYKLEEKKKADMLKTSEEEIRGNKIVFTEVAGNLASYEVIKKVRGEYIVIFHKKDNGVKIDFRTTSKKDVLKLAKLFKGGGHLYAAGAFTKNKKESNIKKRIINFIKKKI